MYKNDQTWYTAVFGCIERLHKGFLSVGSLKLGGSTNEQPLRYENFVYENRNLIGVKIRYISMC